MVNPSKEAFVYNESKKYGVSFSFLVIQGGKPYALAQQSPIVAVGVYYIMDFRIPNSCHRMPERLLLEHRLLLVAENNRSKSSFEYRSVVFSDLLTAKPYRMRFTVKISLLDA